MAKRRRKNNGKNGQTVGYMRARGLVASIFEDLTSASTRGIPVDHMQDGNWAKALTALGINLRSLDPYKELLKVALIGGGLDKLRMNPSIIKLGKTRIKAF